VLATAGVLQELAIQATAGRVFAHIWAATGSPVQAMNCHPFRYGRWLWMHNGYLGDFLRVKCSLVLAVDDDVLAAYLQHTARPRAAALNRELLDSHRADLPIVDDDLPTAWWRLPAAEPYLWRHLAHPLRAAPNRRAHGAARRPALGEQEDPPDRLGKRGVRRRRAAR